jgi:DNA-binding NarL/FixJ family response regulator
MPFRALSPETKAKIKGLRILVAEDEPFVSMEMEDVIVENGAEFIGPFGSLEALLYALPREKFDAAILDVRLGRESCFPAADLLRDAGVPIVFHSGHARLNDLSAAYPASRLCKKPCAVERLLEAVVQTREAMKVA